jgi:GTP-binding protein
MTLIDIRHGPTRLDLDLQELVLASRRERLVVLTKADKVKRNARMNMCLQVQRQLGLVRPPAVVSVRTGDGRKELLGRIDELVAAWRTPS